MKVQQCCKGEDDTNGGKANSMSEDFEVIESRMLVIPLGHQSSLVVIYEAICIALDFKHPLRANDLTRSRSRNKGPSAIALVHC